MIEEIATHIRARISALPSARTDDLRRVRRYFSKHIADLTGKDVVALAKLLIRKTNVPNFIGYELVQHHKDAATALNSKELDDLAQDLNS